MENKSKEPIHPFVDLPEVLAYMTATDAEKKARMDLESLRKELEPLAVSRLAERSDGSRCEACGGPSFSAPNQYKGKKHSPDCRYDELEAAREVAQSASSKLWPMSDKAREAINVEIAKTNLGRMAAEKEMKILKYGDPDRDSFIIKHNDGYEVANGSWAAVTDYFAGTKKYQTVEQVGYRGPKDNE